MRHLSRRLRENLWPGRVVVRQPVGVVRVLVEIAEPCRIVARQFACAPNRTIRALIRIGPIHCGAVRVQNALSFRRYIGGHGQLDRNPQGRAQHRKRNSCIAAGRIEDSFLRRQQPAHTRIAHHPRGCTVFHAAARIRPFRFAQQCDPLESEHNLLEAHKRRRADSIRQRRAKCGLRGNRFHLLREFWVARVWAHCGPRAPCARVI